MCAWLAPKAEELGVDLFPGFAAADLSCDDNGAVQGVIIGDERVELPVTDDDLKSDERRLVTCSVPQV